MNYISVKPEVCLNIHSITNLFDDLCAQIWLGEGDESRLRRQTRRIAEIIQRMES